MSTEVKIEPFLPGHIEVFDLKLSGKVQSVQMEPFHCCTQEPAHALHDPLQTLAAGEDTPTAGRGSSRPASEISCLQVWMKKQ